MKEFLSEYSPIQIEPASPALQTMLQGSSYMDSFPFVATPCGNYQG